MMLSAVNKIQTSLEKPFMPAIFFLGGVTFDTLTLSRIDRLLDNLILLLYLSLLGALVVLTGRMQLGMIPESSSETGWSFIQLVNRTRPYFAKALHFLLGGLFSAYAIFYSQSASLTATAVFFGIIVAFLIANEFLHNRVASQKLLVSLYGMVTFSFFTFFLPVLTGWMNMFIFLAGAALSGGVVWNITRLIFKGAQLRSPWEPVWTMAPALALIVGFSGLYFLNWIPPVPLSLKFGGMYHQVEKIDDGYQLTFEKGAWYQFWKRSDDPVYTNGPVYCFTAVFAPVRLETTVFHHWQYRPADTSDEFSTTDRIPISISGGRASGYRGYTVKQQLDPGEWRVDVEAEDGRVIGRIAFHVREFEDEEQEFLTMTY